MGTFTMWFCDTCNKQTINETEIDITISKSRDGNGEALSISFPPYGHRIFNLKAGRFCSTKCLFDHMNKFIETIKEITEITTQ